MNSPEKGTRTLTSNKFFCSCVVDLLYARMSFIPDNLLSKVDLSELLDPLNARGGPVKLYRPAISYISIYKGLDGPSELNSRGPSLTRDCRGR